MAYLCKDVGVFTRDHLPKQCCQFIVRTQRDPEPRSFYTLHYPISRFKTMFFSWFPRRDPPTGALSPPYLLVFTLRFIEYIYHVEPLFFSGISSTHGRGAVVERASNFNGCNSLGDPKPARGGACVGSPGPLIPANGEARLGLGARTG